MAILPNAEADTSSAYATYRGLVEHDLGPYFGTPCGILSPLLGLLASHDDYHVVSREDNAVAMAAGAAMAGRTPTVLMQNSGFGQSVNALASLVVPYRIPVLLIVSMRGVAPDSTPENAAMGRLTVPILDGLGIEHGYLSGPQAAGQLATAERTLVQDRRSFALLVRPDEFAWKA